MSAEGTGQGEAESSPELNPTADVKRSWNCSRSPSALFPGSLTDRDSGRENKGAVSTCRIQASPLCIPSFVFRHKRLMAFPSKGLQSSESSSVFWYLVFSQEEDLSESWSFHYKRSQDHYLLWLFSCSWSCFLLSADTLYSGVLTAAYSTTSLSIL